MQENAALKDSSGMSREKIEQARDALLQLRTLYIAVNSQQDSPEMGVSPFIRGDDGLYVFTSHLSQHVRDLMAQGAATCMLCADEAKSQNIWARNRLKFAVDAVEIARDDANFGDFHMFQLVPRDGVLVLGFAKAFTVTGSDFAIAAHISKA